MYTYTYIFIKIYNNKLIPNYKLEKYDNKYEINFKELQITGRNLMPFLLEWTFVIIFATQFLFNSLLMMRTFLNKCLFSDFLQFEFYIPLI